MISSRYSDLLSVITYGVATALAALLTLVLTRVLWQTLDPLDFGIWALIDPMLLPAASLLLLGIDHAIVKQLRVDGLSLGFVTGTLLASTLPVSICLLLMVGLVSETALHLTWTSALIITLVGEALMLIMQSAFRATGAVRGFVVLLLSRNLLYLVVLLCTKGQSGHAILSIGVVFLTRGGSVVLVSLLAVAALRPILRINWTNYRDAVRYGFPLLLTTFTSAVADMTDRWFLAEFTGVIAVGIYALYLKLAAIVGQAVVLPFGLWFPPERFRHLNDPDGGRTFFIRVAVILSVICGFLSGSVWLARDPILTLIAPGVVVSPLAVACCIGTVVCLALSQAMNVGLLMPGHTSKNLICSVYSVMATALASGILVPLLGMNGAAISRLLGGFVLVGVTSAWSARIFPVAFPYVPIGFYFGFSAIVLFAINGAVMNRGLIGMVFALILWTITSLLAALFFWNRIWRTHARYGCDARA